MRRNSAKPEPAFAIYHEIADVGKTVAGKYCRLVFADIFDFSDNHDLCCSNEEESYLEVRIWRWYYARYRKKVLTLNGQLIIESQSLENFIHTFPHGGHMYKVEFSDEDGRPYKLMIDGTYYHYLSKLPSTIIPVETQPRKKRDPEASSTTSSNSNDGAGTKSTTTTSTSVTTIEHTSSHDTKSAASTGFSLDVFSDVPPSSSTSMSYDIFAPTSPTAFSSFPTSSSSSKAVNDVMRQFDATPVVSTPRPNNNNNFNNNINLNNNIINNTPRPVFSLPTPPPQPQQVNSSNNIITDPWSVVNTSTMFQLNNSNNNSNGGASQDVFSPRNMSSSSSSSSSSSRVGMINVRQQKSIDDLDVFGELNRVK